MIDPHVGQLRKWEPATILIVEQIDNPTLGYLWRVLVNGEYYEVLSDRTVLIETAPLGEE